MKANAPEKIWLDSRSVFLNKPNKSGLTEYTRTDAFIEKACEWLSNMTIEDMDYKYDGFDTSEGWYRMIEDFRKYMEGE